MSLETAVGQRSASPSSSGRSTPVARATRRTAENELHNADKNVRRYAALIERVLASWEHAPEEWADFIAFLGRLLKAIQTHSQNTASLPHSASIATRLAQCLSPDLPSGVHQKALEVYTYIFATFGDDHISNHINAYLPGLSAVLSFASLNVRPALYSLFEDHIVSLPLSDLRPALKSLILSLLPALEEESSEDFERAFGILARFERAFVGTESATEQNGYFWQCLYLAVITSPTRRQGALSYLTRRLPSLAPKAQNAVASLVDSQATPASYLTKEANCAISPEPGLLVRCFVCGLTDSQILIQRGFLDLLVTHLPLNSIVLQRLVGVNDLDQLVRAAIFVLLRKDMSLNRRLWSWFLGPEPKEQTVDPQSSPTRQPSTHGSSQNSQLRYFSHFGKAALERCTTDMFKSSKPSKPSDKARPFRICLSLMDRWEIGGLIVPQVFLPAMTDLYEYSLKSSGDETAEVIRSASIFFDGVEASLIWEKLLSILQSTFSENAADSRDVSFFIWLIEHFNIKDEEMLTLHIPLILVFLLENLTSLSLHANLQTKMIKIAARLLDYMPSRAFVAGQEAASKQSATQAAEVTDPQNVVQRISSFYAAHRRTQNSISSPPLPPSEMANVLFTRLSAILEMSSEKQDLNTFALLTSMILTLVPKCTGSSLLPLPILLPIIRKTIFSAEQSKTTLPFSVLAALVSLISLLARTSSTKQLLPELIDIEPAVVRQLWNYLSPSLPKYHVEAVRALWQLEELMPSNDTFIASLTGLVRDTSRGSQPRGSVPSENVRRYTVLWNHTMSLKLPRAGHARRISSIVVPVEPKHEANHLNILEQPLMLVLDHLNDPSDPAFESVQGWLRSLPTLNQIFDISFRQISEVVKIAPKHSVAINEKHSARTNEQKLRELDYIFSHFENILACGNDWIWQCLTEMTVEPKAGLQGNGGLTSLADLCLNTLLGQMYPSESLNRRVISILDLLLAGPAAVELRDHGIDTLLIDRLLQCISGEMYSLQGGILKLLTFAIRLRSNSTSYLPPLDMRLRSGSVSLKRPSVSGDQSSTGRPAPLHLKSPPPDLSRCLKMGFTSPNTRYHLDLWIAFLGDVLPTFTDAMLTTLLPLVACFCSELSRAHRELVQMSLREEPLIAVEPESVALNLLDGLQMILDRAYQCYLNEEVPEPTPKQAEPSHTFLSNLATGGFKIEAPPNRNAKANSHLTVILAFHDAIRIALSMWLWSSRPGEQSNLDTTSSATTAYVALKIRNKTRHVLEQIFALEPLESLELLISYWSSHENDQEASAALNLLHVMQVTNPKTVVPATLDALCSRTNPSTLPPARTSTQTLDLTPAGISLFLSAYLNSIEDDAIDEVWAEGVAFMKDVLTNPLPFRQALPHLLSVVLLLAEKLNNTNFGEQRRMRRELGDIFQRILTATFTTLPPTYVSNLHMVNAQVNGDSSTSRSASLDKTMTLVPVLCRITGKLDLILETQDRITTAINSITISLLSPAFRVKTFPKNLDLSILQLALQIAQKAPTAKSWKKEVGDALYDPRLLSTSVDLMANGWFPVLYQLSLHDKERLPDLFSKLLPPSSAGIMFGVGASAARLDADRKTQHNLRRICLLLLSSPQDTYVGHLRTMAVKLAELFDASPSSSPSANIKAELFMLLRALALSTSSNHLLPLWPIINQKLQAALDSLFPDSPHSSEFNNFSLLQACKLLDTLVALSPDEFQLHEWLYVSDTIDAVYRPSHWEPVALSDQLTEFVSSDGADPSLIATTQAATEGSPRKRSLLLDDDLPVDREDIKALPREDFIKTVLAPFLSQLSIHAYEGVYSMEKVDPDDLRHNLLTDILDVSSLVD